MDWHGLGALLASILAAFGGVRRFSGKGSRMRSRIEHDLHLLEKLEAGSTARTELENHIDRSVCRLVKIEHDQDGLRTDPYGLIWMLIFLGLAIGAAVTAWKHPGYVWWLQLLLWLSAAVFLLLTVIGATVTFGQRVRSQKKLPRRGLSTQGCIGP